jgi:hypothetical protein
MSTKSTAKIFGKIAAKRSWGLLLLDIPTIIPWFRRVF